MEITTGENLNKKTGFKPKVFGSRRVSVWFIVLLFVLLAIRAALPYGIQSYVNKRLDQIPEYEGHIGDVDLALWRGAYQIENVKLSKTTGKIPIPFFSSPLVDFSMEWRALLQGKLVGEVYFHSPVITFVNGAGDKNSQLSISNDWLAAIRDLFPFRINYFEIKDGTIRFNDFIAKRKVDVGLYDITMYGRDFSNTRSASEGLVATIDAQGKIEKHADMSLHVKLDPQQTKPTLNLDSSIRSLKLTMLNDVLKAYGGFDAEGGTVSIDLESVSNKGRVKGYLKAIAKDVQLLNVETDTDSGLHIIWEGLVSFFAEIFKNHKHDQIATEIPFEGRFDEPNVDRWESIIGIFKNAFVQALEQGLDNRLKLSSSGK